MDCSDRLYMFECITKITVIIIYKCFGNVLITIASLLKWYGTEFRFICEMYVAMGN